MQDKALRSLLVVVLTLGAAILGLLLLSWLAMAGMMAGGMGGGMMGGRMMGQGSGMIGGAIGVGIFALAVVGTVLATLVWALRDPCRGAR